MANLYDEFGNYIGPEIDDDSDESDESEESEEEEGAEEENGEEGDGEPGESLALAEDVAMEDTGGGLAVILHEDKKYYPSAQEVYGGEAETLVMEEDAQPLEKPLIAPVSTRQFEIHEKGGMEYDGAGETKGDQGADFRRALMSTPRLARAVAVAGHLHHGKTSFVDMLIEETHATGASFQRLIERPPRYTDNRPDEQERGISIKTTPVSLVLPGSTSKSHLVTFFDTPGHPNLSDEGTAALRLSDGVLLVVDAAEGVMMQTEAAVRMAAREGLPVCVLVNKVDRLITELKLPPTDCYHKLRHTIADINRLLEASLGEGAKVDPLKGNVAFSSALHGWSFTLSSFATVYAEAYGSGMDTNAFARRLWGDFYFHPEDRKFRKVAPSGGGERTFVQFVLNPLYKIYSTVIGEESRAVDAMMKQFRRTIRKSELSMDVSPLLRLCCTRIFGRSSGLVDMLLMHVPSVHDSGVHKVSTSYMGPLEGPLVEAMQQCDPKGPLMVQVTKLYPREGKGGGEVRFDALARVLSGTVKTGKSVRVLGESFTPEDDEDCVVASVSDITVYNARYRIPLTEAQAGNVVLLGGIDTSIFKTATICDASSNDDFAEDGYPDVFIFKPLQFEGRSIVKIATEPVNPAELPKMVEGLRSISKTYPMCITKVEESGEHAILGTGELFLDCLMHDLRESFAGVEVQVADPVVSFCETVAETSSLKCFSETANGQSKLTMIAEPLDKGLAEDIEDRKIDLTGPKKTVGKYFMSNYDWDLLASRSVWAFGPEPSSGPNVLLDDTLPGEVDKSLLSAIRMSVVQGFQWGTREGPLCDEPMRGVKMKLLDASICPDPMLRGGGGQLIPAARRIVYSAFLTATPRLMEPILRVQALSPVDSMSAIYNVLSKRRGHVLVDKPLPGTPLYSVSALIPAIESFGFETDLRYHTQGQSFCTSCFDHYAIVPGDPLDTSIVLRPLEPSPVGHLAREFMIKTRRRKGLSEDVSVGKFFDEEQLRELAMHTDVNGDARLDSPMRS